MSAALAAAGRQCSDRLCLYPEHGELDSGRLYIERTPDTVQIDHVDWGFRLSGIYGENYRYTTAYGLTSGQFLKKQPGQRL